jgi:integrase
LQVTRQRYQLGSLRKVVRKNGPWVWEFRYRDSSEGRRQQKQVTLSSARYPTETQAQRAVAGLLLKVNSDLPEQNCEELLFGTLLDRYIAEERLVELKGQKPGLADADGLQYATACSYLTILNRHIRPKWGATRLGDVRPAPVQEWLKSLEAAPKYKAKIKALMYRLFEKAMLWELIDIQRNPMELVELRGISRRRKKPVILTLEQYGAIVDQLSDPYRTMVIVAGCLGLRASEILALKWADIDFENLSLRVTRKSVNGRVSRVKTEYSEDDLPLDPDFASELLRWRSACPATPDGWVFPNPMNGAPYYASEIQKDRLKPAGDNVGLAANGAAQSLGWHTFRHTYRSLLDSGGAPVGVQQKLMRHAQVATTMDVYGNALMESKREANSKVVRMVLRRTG